MNAYILDGGTFRWTEVIDPEIGGPTFEERAVEIICAETRGKARLISCRLWRHEWLAPVSIRLVARDVDEPEGPCCDFALWMHGARLLNDQGDTLEWAMWEDDGDQYYDLQEKPPIYCALVPQRNDARLAALESDI